jgi:sec-independent protein translocase protein TatC
MANPDDHDATPMTVGEHLEELRRRLLWALAGLGAGAACALAGAKWMLQLLERPYLQVMQHLGRDDTLVVLDASAGFVMYLKVALVGGLILASPWVFWQLWRFVAAGLYPRERRWVLPAVPFCTGLFLAGAGFFLFVVAEPMLWFFVGFNDYLGVRTQLTLANHVTMMLRLMVVFGLAFQLPLALAILGRMGLVTARSLGTYRRHVIVGLFVFAALATSPSPVDQVLLALPMWGLYELGVLLVWLSQRRRESENGRAPSAE